MLIITNYNQKHLAFGFMEDRLIGVVDLSGNENGNIGDIYMGRVSRVLPQSDSCFVEYQKGVQGFLSLKEFHGAIPKVGDFLPVMIAKEAIKQKLVTLTIKLEITDSYFSFSIGNPSLGISKKIGNENRNRIKELLNTESISEREYGVVVRTAAETLDDKQFLESYEKQKQSFENILKSLKHATYFQKIHSCDNRMEKLLSTFSVQEISEIVTDVTEDYEEIQNWELIQSGFCSIRLYEDQDYPLAKLYRLETCIADGLNKMVWLKSGGNLVIEQTESMTCVDVNTGKAFGEHKNMEPNRVISMINQEAARELAHQLRLRNITGIIIIDFINMADSTDGEALLEVLRKATSTDKQDVHVVDITPLGLVEVTRKKGFKSLKELLLQ